MRSIALFILLATGCASGTSNRVFTVDNLYGSLIIRDIASDCQVPNDGAIVEVKTTVPAGSAQIPVVASANLRGLLSTQDVIIKNVTGDVVIERALSGLHGVDIPESLRAL
jgi:hypothetical protein